MRLRLTDPDRTGRVIDCRDTDLDPARVLDAVRDPAADGVRCWRASPVHDAVGAIGVGAAPTRRATLAAVARSRGIRVPEIDALADARARLADHATEPTALASEREQVANTSAEDRATLREEVARRRGVVDSRRELGTEPPEEALAAYREAAARLSEVGTEATAATDRLARERTRAIGRYDTHQRRLELEDRVANCERAARAALADRADPLVTRALDGVDETTSLDRDSALAWRLAAARAARLAAPLVVAAGPLDASEIAAVTGERVIRCRDL